MTKTEAITELQRILRMRHYALSTRESASIRDVQQILGHKSLETTMQYVHAEIERVTSPLESLLS